MCRFILASASPRRKEILENVGMKFEVMVSASDESKIDRTIEPQMLVQELAMLKAADVAANLEGDCYVIGADTVVSFNGKILEKPLDEDDARKMLKELSGKTHSVFTGVSIYSTKTGVAISKCQKTDVTFKELSDERIDRYIKSKEPMDKAGAYGIQGKGALFVEEIKGDYFNVVGLPVALLSDMLNVEFGVEI